ncbi:MAG: AMP-binding protein [Pseudomonadales bacterium]|nr:propionyl-CoA synthetase [Pseudomonadales bacterium]NIX09868.1 AMP-binding protein [Pseudomonadales bacterium]
MSYASEYARSLSDPEGFWREKAAELPWLEFPQTILDRAPSGAWRWFHGGKMNSCWLALDRHVADGRGDQLALIYDSPATGSVQRFTFAELAERVAACAGGLAALGVSRGDRVIVYMPMIPEAVIAMLACARIGAVHSVVFGGFAAPELATRIDDAEPKVLLSASCGIEFANVIPYQPLVEEAVSLADHKPEKVVMLQREQCQADHSGEGYLDWSDWEASAQGVGCVPVDATDPLYILYTSGTTGKPKGVVRDNGGHAVALNYSMQAIYGVDAGDVFWAASDVGWVVGHSYIVYGPLIRGCATVLFEGKPVRTPDAGVFWRVIQDHRVKSFFVAPTAFRAIRKEDPDCALKGRYDVSSLQYQFVAGERLDPPTYHWLSEHLHVPVIDHWWQTETGWSICANMAGLELMATKPGSPTLPVPGYDLRILDEDGAEVGAGEEGAVVVKEPLPPGAFPTVWGDHQRYVESYWSRYPGFYLTGDEGYRDDDGYVYIMGRMDDVINVAGHRLSTGQMEETVAEHPAIAECAVVGIADADKGQVPVGLVLTKDGANVDPEALERELVQMVRASVGAFANFRRAVVVERLPKTRSGKILRQVLRKMIDGNPYTVPSTIDDAAIIPEMAATLKKAGVM